MKLFIYEHLTSGACIDTPLPASLQAEGDSMLQAVIRDFQHVPDVKLLTMRDSRLPAVAVDECEIHRVNVQSDYNQGWQHCLAAADAVLLIAPESDGILAGLQQAVQSAGKIELGCEPATTRLCSDKLALSALLGQHGFDTPPGQPLEDYLHQPQFEAGQLVIKPRDGAGAVETYLLDSGIDLPRWLITKSLQNFIVQPYIAGTAISLNALFSDDCVTLLSRNTQQIRRHQHSLRVAGSMPAADGDSLIAADTANSLLQDLHATLPGLWGWIGIDLILARQGPVIVEINPRLTSSYPAIAATTGLNPCQLLSQHWHTKINRGQQ